jgi:hypothetical protein
LQQHFQHSSRTCCKRIFGEIRGVSHNAHEDQRGQAATAFTKQAVASTKKHQVILYGWDKFGGRVLGDIDA